MLWPVDQWLSRSCHHSFGVSERWLQSSSAAGPPFTWPPLSPWAPLTAGCHNQQQPDNKSLGSTNAYTPSANTHDFTEWLWCIWMLTPHTPTFSLAHTPPSRLFLYPLLLVCLCCSHSLSGFFSLFLWSLESGRSRSSSWRGTSCGPEWLRHQLTPVIQHATTSPAAPPLGSSDSIHMTRYNPVLKLEHWIRQKKFNGEFIIIYKSFKWSNMM